MSDMKSGVQLGNIVHNETEDWSMTSDRPVEGILDETFLLDKVFPGRLGEFIYPLDVVLHDHRKRDTGVDDVYALIRSEKELMHVAEEETRMNHIVAEKTFEEEEDVEEEEEEEEEEEGEEEGEDDDEPPKDDEKWPSDDED